MHQIVARAQGGQVKGREVSDCFSKNLHLFIKSMKQAVTAYMSTEPSPQPLSGVEFW